MSGAVRGRPRTSQPRSASRSCSPDPQTSRAGASPTDRARSHLPVSPFLGTSRSTPARSCVSLPSFSSAARATSRPVSGIRDGREDLRRVVRRGRVEADRDVERGVEVHERREVRLVEGDQAVDRERHAEQLQRLVDASRRALPAGDDEQPTRLVDGREIRARPPAWAARSRRGQAAARAPGAAETPRRRGGGRREGAPRREEVRMPHRIGRARGIGVGDGDTGGFAKVVYP